MNDLIFFMRKSLIELDAGLRGDLSITEPMEIMMNAMANQGQPPKWEKLAWASRASLSMWLIDLFGRQKQLENWTGDLAQPKVSWLSGFFNVQAFVTAVMQVACRKNDWALEKVITTADVSKKMTPEEIEGANRDGAYVHGVFMEGARWDLAGGCMEDAFMKELYPKYGSAHSHSHPTTRKATARAKRAHAHSSGSDSRAHKLLLSALRLPHCRVASSACTSQSLPAAHTQQALTLHPPFSPFASLSRAGCR